MRLRPTFVIDTNILLDCFIFFDPAATHLRQILVSKQCLWLATSEMAEEFFRVLEYDHIKQISHKFPPKHPIGQSSLNLPSLDFLFTNYATLVSPAPIASCAKCKDPDDQKFIDLAVAHQCTLYSKDREVLKLRSKLSRQGITVQSTMSIKPGLHKTTR